MTPGLIDGLLNALTFVNLGFALLGCLLGTLVGVLPGLGPASAMAILLPVALYLPPTGSVILLAGIYYGSMYGGSTTAILMNIPGEVASTVTAIDGFAMTKRGRAGQALAIAAIGSFIAGIAGTAAIALIGPQVAELALKFSAPEYFGLVVFSMVTLISFGGTSLLKALVVGVAGIWLATFGVDPVTGVHRQTFGTFEMMKGFDIVPVLVGLFGVAEVLVTAEQRVTSLYAGRLGSWVSMIPRGVELARGLAASVRGTVTGFVLGLLPGMLPALTAYIAYDVEKRVAREPQRFGEGAIEGVAGPEAANNATAMAGFVPLMSLGIPTSPSLAIMLGALMINGLQPGPRLFEEHALFTWTVIASMILANGMLLVLNLPLVGLWARISVVPYRYLGPIVLAVCLIGAYSPRNTLFDVFVAIGFGLLGYVMRKRDWPLAPFILGFLLGPMLEQALRQSMAMSGGSPMIFLERPICATLLAAAIVAVIVLTVVKRRSRAMSRLIHDSAIET